MRIRRGSFTCAVSAITLVIAGFLTFLLACFHVQVTPPRIQSFRIGIVPTDHQQRPL